MKYTLDIIKTGEGIIDELGVKMILHKEKIYVSSHGTGIFSGAIYIIDDDRYIYPLYNTNQCWGYNIVSNGEELAVSGHCDRIYTGYVEILSENRRRILMRGINIGDACGFAINWYDNMWWVSCKYKIWNEKQGFILLTQSIEFPIFEYDNKVVNIFDSNKYKHNDDELVGCFRKDIYDNDGCSVDYRYKGVLQRSITPDKSFFGTSLYITDNSFIIGSNNTVNIYNRDFTQNIQIPIPSISNTRFSYLYRNNILYVGSFGSNDLSGSIYFVTYNFDNNVVLEFDNNSSSNHIIRYLIIIVMFVLIIFALLGPLLYCFFNICIKDPTLLKKKKKETYIETRIEPRYESRMISSYEMIPLYRLSTPEVLQEIYNSRFTQVENTDEFYKKNRYVKEPLSPVTSDLPGAYNCY